MIPLLLFSVTAVVFAVVIYLAWRLWHDQTRLTREDEELKDRIIALNDAQAHRISDHQLRRPLDADDAWQIMVRRGRRTSARNRPPRPGERP